MHKKNIICVGGAEGQCHIIEIIKQLGYYTICVDYNELCEGHMIAHEFHKISTDDIESIAQLGREKKIAGIISTQSDLGLKTATIVAEKLNLKNLGLEKVETFTNKVKMRDFLKKHGYAQPYYRKCCNKEEVAEALENISGKAVIKPIDSQGSRGVSIISKDSWNKEYLNAKQYSKTETSVIVEEYLGNDEYTVEGYIRNGKHSTLAISRKKHYNNVPCVSKELRYDWSNEQDLAYLEKIHNEIIEKTGLPYGITHSEYLKKDGQFYLVEFTARGGGSDIASLIVPFVSGVDIERELVLDTLDLPRDTYIFGKYRKMAVLKFFEFNEGIIESINGIEEIINDKNILKFKLSHMVGDKIMPVVNDTNRHGFFIGGTETKEQLINLINKVEKTMHVVYK